MLGGDVTREVPVRIFGPIESLDEQGIVCVFRWRVCAPLREIKKSSAGSSMLCNNKPNEVVYYLTRRDADRVKELLNTWMRPSSSWLPSNASRWATTFRLFFAAHSGVLYAKKEVEPQKIVFGHQA